MRSETVLRGSKSLAKWQAEHLAVGGEIFPTLASLPWFIRQNKDELQAHNAIIPGKGSRIDPSATRVYKNLDLKGGKNRGRGGGAPPVPPPLRSRFLYRIFHQNFPKNCPVAIQWPERRKFYITCFFDLRSPLEVRFCQRALRFDS